MAKFTSWTSANHLRDALLWGGPERALSPETTKGILRNSPSDEVPKFITIERTSACTFNERQIASVPFELSLAL
jgi:hypothetical protein